MRKRLFLSRLPWVASLALLTSVVISDTAHAEVGFESVGAESSSAAAGFHPDFTSEMEFEPETRAETVTVSTPPGLVANLNALEDCSIGAFRAFGNCPTDSQIGVVEAQLGVGEPRFLEPLYNIRPPHPQQELATFGFYGGPIAILLKVSVRAAGDYGATVTAEDLTAQSPLLYAKTTVWGNPADPVHNKLRLTPLEAAFGCVTACLQPNEERPSGLPQRPFMSNPTACQPQQVDFAATTYQFTGQLFTAEAPLPRTADCEVLSFKPSFQIEPTNHAAGAPTGLVATLRIPQTNSITLPAASAMRAAKVALPSGMTIATGGANGLEACSDEQVHLGKEVASDCPAGSMLGAATIVSPDLPAPLHGAIYQRTPAPGELFRLWLVTDELGVHVKLPGRIEADPVTGQLTVEFRETPQVPVEEVTFEVKGGPTAPLKNPDACGSYPADYEFTPWSGNPPVTGETQPIKIDEGCGTAGFSPELKAGAVNPVGGSYSPFVVNLIRNDGEQNLSGLEVTLPEGELAKLAGVEVCPDSASGSGNCPAGSQIGSVIAATGPGTQPLWIPQPGKAPTAVYLAGPYKGAPYSIVTKVPAQAGPFDLGNVVVRASLSIDPNTTQATVRADPLPQILQGVPILYRTVHVVIDRDQFALNPTSCDEKAVAARVVSSQGAVANPSDRYQVADCASLDYRPTLKARLKGGTKRGAYPALIAIFKTHGKEANTGRLSLAFPHSEFLAQEHIRTVCTRVQFAAGQCPPGSIYGHVRAITPLLNQPLEGSVYLRSSSNPLPDLVFALKGQVSANLVARIDSVRGGLRATLPYVPDVPVTEVVMRMQGGKRGLLVNSVDICASKHRATVKLNGQNGKLYDTHPLLRPTCGGKR